MEMYLRIGLLFIVALIVSLVFFESWQRKRVARLARAAEANKAFDADAVLGLNAKAPKVEIAERDPIEISAAVTAEFSKRSADDIRFQQESLQVQPKILTTPSLVKEEGPVITAYNTDDYQEPSLSETPSLSSRLASKVEEEVVSAPIKKDPPSKEDYLMLSVVAKSGQCFESYDLLQAITSTGMRFGEMNIFHYQTVVSGEKITWFSLASATEPGDFDLDKMGHFTCTGLTMFTNLREVPNPKEAFNLMLKAAEQLADDLDGLLRSGQRLPWNEQTKRQCLQKVLQYQYNKQPS